MAKKVYQKHVLSLTSLFFPFRGEKTDRLVSPSTSQLLVLSSEMGAWAGRATDHFLFLFKKVLICLAVPGLQSSLWHAGSLAVAYGNLFPDQGSNLGPLHWKHGVLATGPPGKCLHSL